MKVVCGLGNPGPQYDATRHNVGWWVVEHLAAEWGFDRFRGVGPARTSSGEIDGEPVMLVEPLTYMNRSGAAVAPLRALDDFDPQRELLIVVDDAALDVGRIRFRPRGSAGGHNGLRSIEASLGTREYARLRIGVGKVPDGSDMVDWVLSPFPTKEEEEVLALLPEITLGVRVWVQEGIEAAMTQHNC